MPKPGESETEQEFMSRCIPQLIDEGREQEQAVAICASIWDEHNKSEEKPMKQIKEKQFFDHNFTIKSSDDDKYVIECIGSKELVDRDGDVVKIDGIDLTNFKKNPRVLWSHDYWGPPIGKALKVWKEDKQLNFKIEFAREDVYPFAGTIYKLYKNGFLNSFSIGFRPEAEFAKFNDKRGGYDFEKVELIEISAVNIPSNVHAVITDIKMQDAIKNKMFTKDEVDKLEIFLKSVEKEIKKQKEITENTVEIFEEIVDDDDEQEPIVELTEKVKQLKEQFKSFTSQMKSDFEQIVEQINEIRSTDNYIKELLSEDLDLSGQKTFEKDSENQPPEEDFEDFCKQLLKK